MVTLVTNDIYDIIPLEQLLLRKDIEYEIIERNLFSMRPPYLVVDGVPLDTERAIKWVRENYNED